MFAKKIPDIPTTFRAFGRSFIALLIAESTYLQTASAIKWTIDFQKKPVECFKCADLFAAMGTQVICGDVNAKLCRTIAGIFFWSAPSDFGDERFKKASKGFREILRGCKTKIEDEHECSWDIVFENGSITREESKMLFEDITTPFGITFRNCSGVLDANKDFQDCVTSLNFENCEFTIVKDCFAQAKNLEKVRFRKTKLIPVGNGLESLFPAKVAQISCDPDSFVSPCGMPIQEAVTGNCLKKNLFSPEYISKEMAGDVLKKEALMSDIQKEYEKLVTGTVKEIKEAKELNAKHEKEIERLKEEVKEEKTHRISAVDNLNKELQRCSERKKKLLSDLEKKEGEYVQLCKKFFTMQDELIRVNRENRKCNEKVEFLEKKNGSLSVQVKSLTAHNRKVNGEVNDLQTSKSKLEEENKRLREENAKLKELNIKQSETVELAKGMLERNKKSEKETERLKEISQKKNDEISALENRAKEKDDEIKELTKRFKVATEWMKYAHSLIRDLKKNVAGTAEILRERNYNEQIQKVKDSIKNESTDCKKQNKKGRWEDFKEAFGQFGDDNGGNANEEDEEESEDVEIRRNDKITYRGRGNYQKGGYFRGNYGRKRGGRPMVNRGRGGYRY